MINNFSTLFLQIFSKNGLDRYCSKDIIEKFEAFTSLLLEENSHTNLTAIRQIPDVIAKHYADSLLAVDCFPQNASVIDIGCGGGFPTFPLAIIRPDLQITALDSTQKKINFVEKTAKQMHLTNITPICARAEDPSIANLRENFQIATSRAMARMNVLTELALPFVAIGGSLIALKGAQGDIEAQEAKNAISKLGGTLVQNKSTVLYTETAEEARHILTVKKEAASPKQYPRVYATILKKPL